MTSTLLILALGAAVAGLAQGLSGFAFALVSLSIWAWFIDPKLAVVLAVFGGLVGQILGAILVRRVFNLRMLLPFLIGGALGIPLGIALVPRLDPEMFKALLGLLLIILCPGLLFAQRLPPVAFGGKFADGVAGFLGGVCSGIGGFAGPIPTLWCALRQYGKDQQRNIIQNFNLAVLSFTMLGYGLNGSVTLEMLPMFGVVLAATIVPAILGARLYIGISEAAFRNIVLTLLTASGIALLVSAVPHLWARV